MKINLKMMEYPYHSVVTFSEIKILLMFQKHLTTICFLFSGFKKPLLSRFKKPLIIGNIFLQRLLTAAYFVDFKLRLLEVNNSDSILKPQFDYKLSCHFYFCAYLSLSLSLPLSLFLSLSVCLPVSLSLSLSPETFPKKEPSIAAVSYFLSMGIYS